MEEAIAGVQFFVFVIALIFGICSALFYDFFRIKRYLLKTNKVFVCLEDILFWLIIAFVGFFLFQKINGGNLRIYIFIGFFIGAIGYSGTLSKFITAFFIFLFFSMFKGVYSFFLFLYHAFMKVKNLTNKQL